MRILCLDFDGVIHSYESGWHGPGIIADGPVPGALDFIEKATRVFDVHIYSSRTAESGGKEAMQHWMMEHMQAKHPKWTLRELIRFVYGTLAWPDHKPSAFLTIDDRAWTFKGEFPDIDEMLLFKPWNK